MKTAPVVQGGVSRKRDGVTLQLLWEEYVQVHPDGCRDESAYLAFVRTVVSRERNAGGGPAG